MIAPVSTTVPSRSKRTTGYRTRPRLETERAPQLGEQLPARRRRRRCQERGDARSLLGGERDGRLRRVVLPDAEANLRRRLLVAEVARDAQRLRRVTVDGRMRREELDELPPLRRGAPGAVTEPVLDAI